jgi:hypothetical protein
MVRPGRRIAGENMRELFEFLERSAADLCLLLLVDRHDGPVQELTFSENSRIILTDLDLVHRTTADATISWTSSASGFVLESSLIVGAGANWAPVAGAPNPIMGTGSLNPATGGSAAFYRLRN